MAPFLFLLLFLSGAASDLIVVTVHPGDDVILPCQAAGSSIRAVEWTRPDLEPDTVLLYRDEHLDTYDQHPSFNGRVDLVDRDLKDGDVSLTLKNVRRHDTGTYECRVITAGSDPIRTIRTIRIVLLQVTDPDLIVVTVDPGDDVILPCRAADPSIRAVKWTRPDLKPDIVLLYSDGHLKTDDQHPSFKDRVELVDRHLKDRDVSLILKNVSSIDTGTYECLVITDGSDGSDPIRTIRPIRTVRLQVPGPEDRNSSPGGSYVGLAAAVAAVLALAAAAVVGVLMYKRPKKKRSGQPDDDEASAAVPPAAPSRGLENINDNGTYELRVEPGGSGRKKRAIIDSEPIRILDLQFTDSGSEDGDSSPEDLYGGLLLVTAAVVGVLTYKRRKNKRSGQPADDDDDEESADNFI